jgi:nicotinamide-nucleotide amidase
MHPMFKEQALPWLLKNCQTPLFLSHSYKTTGLGESIIEERLAPKLSTLTDEGLQLGYCARIGEVEVRLDAKGDRAALLLEQARKITEEILRDHIFGEGADLLEQVVVRELARRKKTLACAESCSGGLLAHRLTNIPGASEIFLGGIVAYANAVKEQTLAVSPENLLTHGAVSEQVAQEMAEGVRSLTKSDYALGITGIAGPTGGTEQKPIGTVFIALAHDEGTSVHRFLNQYDRETFKFIATQQALELLRQHLIVPAAAAKAAIANSQ